MKVLITVRVVAELQDGWELSPSGDAMYHQQHGTWGPVLGIADFDMESAIIEEPKMAKIGVALLDYSEISITVGE